MRADVEALFPRVIALKDVCVRQAEGGFLRGCEPRFDHRRNHTRDHVSGAQVGRGTTYEVYKAPQIRDTSTIVASLEDVVGGLAARGRELSRKIPQT